MEKQNLWYSPNNFDYDIFKCQSLIAKRVHYSVAEILQKEVMIHIAELKGVRYWVFTHNYDPSNN